VLFGGFWVVLKYSNNKQSIYADKINGLEFALPIGWFAKPYPYSSSTVFVNPKDFEFPAAWGGPLTPITVMVAIKDNLRNDHINALLKDEPGLQVTESLTNGLKTLIIEGVPQNTTYLEGRYYKIISIQKGPRIITVDCIGDTTRPQYLKECDELAQSIKW